MIQDKFNICYISNSATPSQNASSLQIAKLCEYISKLGHQVKLITPNTGLKKNFYKFYNIKKKHRYKVCKIKFFNKFPTGINYYLFSILSILKSNYRQQDFFLTRNFFISFILSSLKKKHILEIHDDIKIEGRIVRFLVKYIKILNFKSLIKIITTTNTLKRQFRSYGVNKKKIFVLHNASSFKSQFKKYSKKKKKLNIGYFGSIYKSRGIEMILKISKKDNQNNYFVYGGSVKQITKLRKQTKNKNIHFFSHIPYPSVYKKLLKIDLCILPYTSKITVAGNVGNISNYTSPLKLFDYMKLGKLILCSNLKVLREVLKHNENSILIKNFTEEKNWLKVITKINGNFKKYDKIRKSAFEYAMAHDMDWRTSKLLSFYKFSN